MEKKKIRFKDDKTLVEDQPRKKQTWPEVQHESAVEDVEAPVWWQLGVEGHSYNRRNRNRVRRYLRRTLEHLEAREDIPESAKHKERQRRNIQLESLQRPRRRDKCTEIWKGWWKKRRVKPMTIRSRAYDKNCLEGRNVPDCRKGRIMPGLSSVDTSYQTEGYWCSRSAYTRRRSAGDRLPAKVCNSGRASRTGNRKYNVGTGRGQRRGNKRMEALRQEQRQQQEEEALRRELRQQQKREMKAPWNYEAQNRANAELLMANPRERRPEGRALSILTGGSYGTCSSINESAILVSGRPVGAAQESVPYREVPFDFDNAVVDTCLLYTSPSPRD